MTTVLSEDKLINAVKSYKCRQFEVIFIIGRRRHQFFFFFFHGTTSVTYLQEYTSFWCHNQHYVYGLAQLN